MVLQDLQKNPKEETVAEWIRRGKRAPMNKKAWEWPFTRPDRQQLLLCVLHEELSETRHVLNNSLWNDTLPHFFSVIRKRTRVTKMNLELITTEICKCLEISLCNLNTVLYFLCTIIFVCFAFFLSLIFCWRNTCFICNTNYYVQKNDHLKNTRCAIMFPAFS